VSNLAAHVRTAAARIRSVGIFRVSLPLADPFQHASSGLVTTLEEVVAVVRATNGLSGYGEVRGNCAYVTGDTPERVSAVALALAPLLIDQSAEDLAPLLTRLDRAIVGNSAAKALLDIALHDLAARIRGVSVATLIGGRMRDRLPTDISVAFGSPQDAAAQTRRAVDTGFRVVKVRVGADPGDDEARLSAVREVVDAHSEGRAVTVAVDANGSWSPKEAVQRLRRWEHHRLGWIEQPVSPHDVLGLRLVRAHLSIPVMADESVQGPREVLELLRQDAVDMFHFKLIKAGGFGPLRRMMAIAEAAGVPYMIGQMDEGMLATAAAIHAGAGSSASYFEVHGYKRVAAQPFRGLQSEGGAMVVPDGPGLGVEVDEDALTPVQWFGSGA
jgi:L-alanine-DL-glutamate epimerase-like enolase superfamily enzyme